MKILFLSFYSLALFAQNICHELYKANIGRSQSNKMEILAQLNRVDDTLNLLSRQLRDGDFNGSYYFSKIQKDYEIIEKSLLNGNPNAARVKVASVFSRVETSYLKVLQSSKLTKALREAHQLGVIEVKPLLKEREVIDYFVDLYAGRISSLDDIARVLREIEEEIVQDIRVLGKNFQRYEHYKESLNTLKKANYCTAKCQQAIKELENEVSLIKNSKRSLVNDFIGTEKTITLNKVRRVFNSHPETILIQRKKELLFEGIGVLKRFINKYSLLRRLTYYLADNVSPRFRGLFKMLRSVFDERYLAKHSRGIERIINSELSPAQKYSLMKDEVRNLDEKMFWIDLSRTQNNKAKQAWQEIKDATKRKNKTDELNEMLDAQRVGEILGSPRNRNIRNAIRIISTLAIVGGSVAYFSFDLDDDEDDEDEDRNNTDEDNDGNGLDTDSGTQVDLNNGEDLDLENQNSDSDDDSVTVLIDYLSPEDKEIEDLMIDLIQVNNELEQN